MLPYYQVKIKVQILLLYYFCKFAVNNIYFCMKEINRSKSYTFAHL